MGTSSVKKLAADLQDISASSALAASERGQKVLREVLASSDARLLAQAARLIEKNTLGGLEEPLCAAFRALSGERASADPGCLAKEALLAALDATEAPAIFAEAAMYTQPERHKGGPRDTAARVRSRGLLGLARTGHPDALIFFGAGLADRDASVRLSAARAVVHRGQREGAGLLLLRLGAGDPEPEIAIECLRGLFVLAPELGQRQAKALLREADERTREQTLHALGTAPDDGAIELLAAQLEASALASERRQVIEALALSQRPRARSLLLGLVADGRPSEAEAALSALAVHAYDPRLVEQLRAVVSPELAPLFRRLYPA